MITEDRNEKHSTVRYRQDLNVISQQCRGVPSVSGDYILEGKGSREAIVKMVAYPWNRNTTDT